MMRTKILDKISKFRRKIRIPASVDAIKLADKIKKGMGKMFLEDVKRFRKVDKIKNKKFITKKEAIMIADRVKSGMSIKVMKDLEEIKVARSKFPKAA